MPMTFYKAPNVKISMHEFDEKLNTIREKLGLDNDEIARRKSFLEITDGDVKLLQSAHPLLAPLQTKLVDELFDHIASSTEMVEAITGAGVSVERLKTILQQYFDSLVSGNYDDSYIGERLKIGLAHQKLGIKINWYHDAYAYYLSRLQEYLNEIPHLDRERLNRVFKAVNKIANFDIALAFDAFIYSKKQTIVKLQQRQNDLIEGIAGFIWEFDVVAHQYRYVSGKVHSMLGYSDKQWLDNPDFQQQIVTPEHRQQTLTAFNRAVEEGRDFTIEYRVKAADGHPLWVNERVSTEKNRNGKVVLLRGLMLDIDELKHHQERISYLATYDELTGLPNRHLFASHLQFALAEAKRYRRKQAIMFLDLDGFKDVNDSLGHEAGDQLLKTIGKRLREQILRKADFVARFGGDEFCIILENHQNDFHPEHVAERCFEELGKPTLIANNTIYPRVSIGIAFFPDDGDTAEALLQCADNAMYAAKASGKKHYAFYNRAMTVLAESRLKLANDLRMAVEKGHFELVFQPQVSLTSGKMLSVEALIRWHDPKRGVVSPDDFIPMAEKIGLICNIGEWALKTASRQFVQWRQAGVPINHVAVNISGSHFRTGKLPATVMEIMEETGIRPEELEIEITEGVLQTNQECIPCFKKLNQLGIKIAIDDFGTGYSCLDSLTRLPIHCLKIDKAFIQNVLADTNDSAIVATIVSMSRILKFNVVAEGVETLEQLNYLQGIGCDIVQGYFFSKPVDAERITEIAYNGFLPSSTKNIPQRRPLKSQS